MSSDKKTATTLNAGTQSLKIGSRVRCTDDSVAGRITWANGTSVKIRWNDGEQVTWRRDSLAGRPIEFLAETDGVDQATPPREPAESEQAECIDSAQAVLGMADAWVDGSLSETPFAGNAQVVEPVPLSTEATPEESAPLSAAESASSKPQRQRKATKEPREKKLSALDAAAMVLRETGQAMNCQELIAAMAEKGYWASPRGKTPQATLYSAMAREITTQGANSRFVKHERGKFARNVGA